MPTFSIKYSILSVVLLWCLVGIVSTTKAQPNLKEAVIEIKNFTSGKSIPILNEIFKENSGIAIKGYCPGQDLVVFSYDSEKFQTDKDVAIFLEDKGLIAYLKENMTSSEVNSNCKTKYEKIKTGSKVNAK